MYRSVPEQVTDTLRVLLVHNFYRQGGGEDRVFETEASILREHGHDVVTHTRRNPPQNSAAVLRLAGQAFWNQTAYRELQSLIRQTKPDIVHLHNTFPLLSPAPAYAARDEGVPVVQTLHNYRLLCPNGLLFREGQPCHKCMAATLPWPAVVHACYRDSYAASAVAAAALATHRAHSARAPAVDRFIAPTEFARQQFIVGGLAAHRVCVKSHVVHPDPGPGPGGGGFAIFVGRLSSEKGIETLLVAARRLAGRLPLVIVGGGPLEADVRHAAAEIPEISWLGPKDRGEVQALVGRATCLIAPSLWYETFCLVVAEAFARGTPVVVSKLGALAELVDHGRTGLHFQPGDPDDLAEQLEWIASNPTAAARMRENARSEYETHYSVSANYPVLRRIYAEAMTAGKRPT
jgi:glycosyltransferase involved in cell wall biosynthesis